MNILDKIEKLANKAREVDNYQLAAVLTRIATDVGFVETKRYFIKRFKVAQTEITKMQKELSDAHMYKLSEELDVIARDIESRIITFSAEDPIEAVLDSYKIIHKVAKTASAPKMQEILAIAEREDLTDAEIASEVKMQTMGMPEQDKQNIFYVLEKDYNIGIPTEKTARSEFIKDPKTAEDKKHNHDLINKVIEDYDGLPEDERKKYKLPASFPSESYIWSGFAYESPIPYQQSSQLNYWSLASKKEEKILKRIAKTRK